MTALAKSLEKIDITRGHKFTVYSDSYSALLAIKKYNPQHPIIQRIQELLYKLSVKSKSVSFCWVPAHVGIQGNELADSEAKAVITKDILFHYIPVSDMKSAIRKHVKKKWQERWSSLDNNRKYRSIRNSITRWSSSYQKDRRTEIILSRLRIGHTHLTHKFLLEGSDAPECARCNTALSVEHILVHCPNYLAQRHRFNLFNKSLSELLNDEADVPALVGFLKATGLYSLI